MIGMCKYTNVQVFKSLKGKVFKWIYFIFYRNFLISLFLIRSEDFFFSKLKMNRYPNWHAITHFYTSTLKHQHF